jgi:hypothetical protein
MKIASLFLGFALCGGAMVRPDEPVTAQASFTKALSVPECTKDAECPLGVLCDTTQGTCTVPGCTVEHDCPEGQVCMLLGWRGSCEPQK